MNFYELVHSHRSIRKYQSREVPEEVLERILQAAIRASSSGNMQAFSIIVTRDEDVKRELYDLHFQQSMVLEAPLLLTFCADFHRMREWLKLRNAPENFDNLMSFMIGAIDAVLASQNAALAVEAEGLGICYMGTTLANCDKIAQVLKCPKHVVPVVGFSLGYAHEAPPARDRLPLEGLMHLETYQDYDVEDIKRIYSQRETMGMERYRSVPKLHEQINELEIENLAQVYTRLKYTRESHVGYSQTILNCLKRQGFA